MKTKSLILSILCLLAMWQMKGQAPPSVYTNVPSGDQTLIYDTIKVTDKWYKWTNTSSTILTEINLAGNGVQYKLSKAELYAENSGTLTLLTKDTIRTNGYMRVYGKNLSTGTTLYVHIINQFVSCPGCSGQQYPLANISFSNYSYNCNNYAPPCDYVYNGSFEDYNIPCSGIGVIQIGAGNPYQQFGACNWTLPAGVTPSVNVGTADYYNACAQSSDIINSTNSYNNWQSTYSGIGYPINIVGPHTGVAYAGFYVYNPSYTSNYKEYVTQQLTNALTINNSYTIKFWVRLSTLSRYAVRDIDVLLTNGIPSQTGAGQVIPTSGGQFVQTNVSGSPLANQNGWVQLTANFTASSAWNQITIGNFEQDISVVKADIGGLLSYSYYYIDDVSLRPTSSLTLSPQNAQICANSAITLTVTPGNVGPYTWSSSPTTSSLSTVTGSLATVAPNVTTTYSVSTGNCANSDVATVVVGGDPLILTASPNPACQGGTITLTAISNNLYNNYKWYTNPSFYTITSSNTYTFVENSSGTKTYTVTGYNSNGCAFTNTVQIKVIPKPTYNIAPNPICAGLTATLTTNTNNYYFYDGDNMVCEDNSPCTFSYHNPGTYTITYDGYSNPGNCPASYTQAITVNPPLPSYTYTVGGCDWGVYCFNNTSSCSSPTVTTWSWAYGNTSGTIGTSTLSAPCFTFTASGTYTVSLTQSNNANPDGPATATSIQTLVVNLLPALCCNTPSMTLTGNISNYGITSFGSGLFEVTGTLIINVPSVSFTSSQLRMAPNAKILVAPSCSLALTSSHLFSCTNMWEGIELQSNSQLFTSRLPPFLGGTYTTIDDAHIAVYVNASGITAPNISLNYTTFSKNAVGVKIENYAGGSSSTYPISMVAVGFQGNVATAYSPSTVLKTYLQGGITPVNYPTTIYGMQLNNISRIMIGNTSSFDCTFQNLQIGVRGLKSNVLVHRCTFQNLTPSLDNKGIWLAGDNANSIIPPGGFYTFGTKYRLTAGNNGNSNNFKNLKYGIYTDSCMTSYISNNTFYDVSNTGVAVYRSNFFYGPKFGQNYYSFMDRDTVMINNNTMSALPAGANVLQNGIGLYDNYYLFYTANTNTLSLKPTTGIWSTGEGRYHASTNYNSFYNAQYNIINGNGNYGFYEINSASLRSTNNNTITVGTGYCAGFFDTPNVGVFSLNSPYAVIKENIIDETSLGAAPSCMIGVYAYNGNQDYIGCNLMKNTNISTAVAFNNFNSTYRGNVMNGAIAGLYLVNGTMGNLGASGDAAQNEWISTAYSSYSSSMPTSAYIYFDGASLPSNPRYPNNNIGVGTPAIPFTPFSTSLGTLGCTQYHKGGNNSDIQPKEDNDNIVNGVINGTIAFGKYQEGMLWEHRNGVLSLLKDSLLDNGKPLFKQFRNQQANTNLGKINTLMRGLGDYAGIIQNKSHYQQQLNSITTSTNVIESNYKLFMNEYINNVVGVAAISKSTYANIQTLAQKCPFTDGAVVFNARALMKIWGDDQVYSNACETIVLPDAKLAGKSAQTIEPVQENVLVYPNPNNGTFSVAYTFEQNGQIFALYDLMGREIMRMSLEKNAGIKEISNNDLNNGVYFYKITRGNNILFNGKLIINK